jgi:hypothetical protein
MLAGWVHKSTAYEPSTIGRGLGREAEHGVEHERGVHGAFDRRVCAAEHELRSTVRVPLSTICTRPAPSTQKAPDLNAARPPLTWQTDDIWYRAARHDDAGNKVENAVVTVVWNGKRGTRPGRHHRAYRRQHSRGSRNRVYPVAGPRQRGPVPDHLDRTAELNRAAARPTTGPGRRTDAAGRAAESAIITVTTL